MAKAKARGLGLGLGLGGGTPAAGPFSASEAAFAGLRLLTREPRTWLIWAALMLAFSLLVGTLTVGLAGPAMMELMAANRASPREPAMILALMGRVTPMYGLVTVCSLLFYAVAFAAVNRAVLRAVPSRSAHLAVGGDELRQLIVLVLLFLVLLGVYLGAVIVGVGGALALAAAHVGGSTFGAGGLTAPAVLLMVGLVIGTVVFVMTRLSLASPIALDTGRIDLGASWRLTRGRFWALFGAYVLAWLVAAVILIAVGVAFTVATMATGGGLSAARGLFQPDMSSLQAYFGPVHVAWIIVNAALGPVFFALSLGAPAGAYAQLRATATTGGPGPAATASDLPRFGR